MFYEGKLFRTPFRGRSYRSKSVPSARKPLWTLEGDDPVHYPLVGEGDEGKETSEEVDRSELVNVSLLGTLVWYMERQSG